jgi:hypothetical protein
MYVLQNYDENKNGKHKKAKNNPKEIFENLLNSTFALSFLLLTIFFHVLR